MPFRVTPLLVTLLAAAALLACTKTDPPQGGSPSATASAATSATAATSAAAATASASAEPTASAAPSASAATSAAPSASAATSAAATATAATKTDTPPPSSATPAASGSAEAAAACGKKPLPDCPLQAWMKKNMNPPMAAQDLPALATALEQSAKLGPPGYGNWASIANDGAKAAKAGDLAAAKASCRTCHDQYKQKYKDQHRTRKI